jgi:septal ring factor EnvC (AmiA/AmiB activator)
MTETENIILEHLRHMRRALDDTREDVREIKVRASSLETGLAQVQVEVAQVHVKIAEQSGRIDRLADRVERIERRLDLAEV